MDDPAVADQPDHDREDEVYDRGRPAALVQLSQAGYDQTAE
ncbi:MAG: hypothetical protein OXD39_08865 [Gemmatimonadetes bacterium]|nr:hypothetical protein [Gemmatimonadota bacterium]